MTPECAEHWRKVRLGLCPPPTEHDYQDDGAAALRSRALGLIHAAWGRLREANDLLAAAEALEAGAVLEGTEQP